MPSTLRLTEQQTSHIPPKKKFRTVLGFGTVFRDLDSPPFPASFVGRNATFSRKSLDTSRSLDIKRYHKHKPGRPSLADGSLFTPIPISSPDSPNIPGVHSAVIDISNDMKELDMVRSRPAGRRPPLRIDAQDGPWSISVAETPDNAHSYSLYVKTPTHNLTLTRTVMEIVELDRKLHESYPDVKIPLLPINADALPPPPPKRKSTFLNTLSRFASPSSKANRQGSTRRMNNINGIPSGLPTPLTSPSGEIGDPFSSFMSVNGDGQLPAPPPPSSNSTALAAYLTTISNMPALRQARIWKRFVHVRTDDLESVRVERAIKRVRSDLAAHVGLKPTTESGGGTANSPSASAAPSENGSVHEKVNGHEAHEDENDVITSSSSQEDIKADDPDQVPDAEDTTVEGIEDAPYGSAQSIDGGTDVDGKSISVDESASILDGTGDEVPSTPVVLDQPTARVHRSHSCDPSTRHSRIYASSIDPLQDPSSSQTEEEEDDSSTSTTGRKARGKRSKSRDPKKEKESKDKDKEKKKKQRKVIISDFEMMRVLGKGCAGKVLLVRHKATTNLYALKAITKRHVLAHQELLHTLTEQAVLKRMAYEGKDPFVVRLWWSFHDKDNLFLVMDFHPGGDLATQLARWGRLGRDRARFYAAEIVEGVEGLHAAGVIYRDLKPENILIGADGHIVLTDFGLSKEFSRRTSPITAPSTPSGSREGEFYSDIDSVQPATPSWMKGGKGGELDPGWPGQTHGHTDSTSTFCGTAEYLAPEVIQGLPYSYEVDWWSFGTMLYEMLTGITPFWADNHSDMYVRVLQAELQFPDDRVMDQDTKSLIRGLLQRNPALRICEPRIKRHPYFSMIDWSHVYYKRYIPPYIPPIDPSNASDTQNFDDTFLDMAPVLDEFNDSEQMDTDQEPHTDTDRTDGEESNTTPSQSRSSSIHPGEEEMMEMFDGYSFKGRHSVLIDDEEEEEATSSSEESDEELEAPSVEEVMTVAPNGVLDLEEVTEPKTPEARPSTLPEIDIEPTPTVPPEDLAPEEEEPLPEVKDVGANPRTSKELPVPDEVPVPPALPEKDIQPKTTAPPKAPPARSKDGRTHRARREKSGVPALDRYLSDAVNEVEEPTEREDDEDDDWDFIDAVDGEDRNGTKGPSLFARGVVDRYRLAVFRKVSTPHRSAPRSASGMSKDSQTTPTDSPSPTQRRGRNPGLTFRKHPRQFLRQKSPPPSSFSSKSGKSLTKSGSATLSASTGSSAGLLTPSTSLGGSLPLSPSLKSRESATSVGDNSLSSSQSGGENSEQNAMDTVKGIPPPTDEPEKRKNKKLKKYKENAEKVFSLFSSPR